jgi:hypothetical protein
MRRDHDGHQIRGPVGSMSDWISSSLLAAPNLTIVKAITLHLWFKRHDERSATMAGVSSNRRIEQ